MTDPYRGLLGVPGPTWQPVRLQIGGRTREREIRAGICPCDPTQGQSCRHCDGTAAEEREAWRDARAAARRRR